MFTTILKNKDIIIFKILLIFKFCDLRFFTFNLKPNRTHVYKILLIILYLLPILVDSQVKFTFYKYSSTNKNTYF